MITSIPDSSQPLTAEERQRLLVTWNQTALAVPSGITIVDQVAAQARQHPNRLALQQGAQTLSFNALDQRASCIARRLLQAGLQTEEPVLVLMETSLDFVCAILGILKAGGSYIPLDESIPASRAAFIAGDCGARFALVQKSLKGLLDGTGVAFLNVNDPSSSSIAIPPIAPQQRAYVIYTSGSTGKPKGVEIEHHSLLNLVTVYQHRCKLTPDDRASMLASVSFDASVADLWPYLAVGASVHIPPPHLAANAEQLMQWITRNRITIAFVPTVIAEIALQQSWPANVALRLLITGGDTLHVRPPPGLSFQTINVYGPTENTVGSTWSVVSTVKQDERPPIGRPFENVQTYVLDEQLQPVAVGTPGELYLGGAQVARGYLNRPELTLNRFIPDPFSGRAGARLYRTGDSVRWRPDGELDFIGRLDDQVQIRGNRVELGEVEEALRLHPSVHDVSIRPLLADNCVQGLTAYVVADGEPRKLRPELRAFLCERLPQYMLPQYIIFLPALPRSSSSGKIDRQALPLPDPKSSLALSADTEPRNDLERQLIALFEDVLQVGGIGIADNFFDLGGHSLLSLRLLDRIDQHFGIRLSLATLFQSPTVAQLAPRLSTDPAATALQRSLPASIIPLRTGTGTPLFLVTGAGGGSHWFQGVATHLVPPRPVYALEMMALSDKAIFGSIQDIADEFLSALRQMQPQGPYLIGGFSMGGHVAYEMAQRLHAAGERIDLLALLDSCGPSIDNHRGRRVWNYLTNFVRRSPAEKRAFFEEKIAWVRYLLMVRNCNRDTRRQQQEINRVYSSQAAAAERYQAQPWHADIVILRAAKRPNSMRIDEYCGWRPYLNGRIFTHRMPGDHFTFLKAPHDVAVARLLDSYIAAAESGSLPAETLS